MKETLRAFAILSVFLLGLLIKPDVAYWGKRGNSYAEGGLVSGFWIHEVFGNMREGISAGAEKTRIVPEVLERLKASLQNIGEYTVDDMRVLLDPTAKFKAGGTIEEELGNAAVLWDQVLIDEAREETDLESHYTLRVGALAELIDGSKYSSARDKAVRVVEYKLLKDCATVSLGRRDALPEFRAGETTVGWQHVKSLLLGLDRLGLFSKPNEHPELSANLDRWEAIWAGSCDVLEPNKAASISDRAECANILWHISDMLLDYTPADLNQETASRLFQLAMDAKDAVLGQGEEEVILKGTPEWGADVWGLAAAHKRVETSEKALASIKEVLADINNYRNGPAHQIHIVAKGDTLRSMAQAFYGDAEKWEVIFEANRDIGYENLVKPGTKLIIPNPDNPGIMPSSSEALESIDGLDKHIEQLFPGDRNRLRSEVDDLRGAIEGQTPGAAIASAKRAEGSRVSPSGFVWAERREEDVECVDSAGKSQRKRITYYYNSIGMRFVYVSMMDRSASVNSPIKAFYIGAGEVSQRHWSSVMGGDGNGSYYRGDELPVESVNWNRAVEFCGELSRTEGKSYRLPTEAEWEYACRAASITKFSFGDTITAELANFRPSAGTKPVGSYPPNLWGIYDMHGNVYEWCKDAYRLGQKIMRGGSYRSYGRNLESGHRAYSSPDDKSIVNGFRVVLEVR